MNAWANGNLDFFWVEKYRPRSFEEILGQPVVKVQLQQVVDTKNLPNRSFLARGTGKSSAAEVVARGLSATHGRATSPSSTPQTSLNKAESTSKRHGAWRVFTTSGRVCLTISS